MALFVDAAALANLERHDPGGAPRRPQLHRLLPGGRGRQPLRLRRALRRRRDRPVSQLELELQAEVDKFVCCCAARPASTADQPARGACTATSPTPTIWTPTNASATAPRTSEASRYAAALERRFVAREQTDRDARRAAPLLPHGPARQARPHRAARLIVARRARRRATARASASMISAPRAGPCASARQQRSRSRRRRLRKRPGRCRRRC